MLYIQTQECWTSNYTIHAIIIIIAVSILSVVVYIAIKLCIEQKRNIKNAFAQKSKTSYYQFFTYISFSMLSYSFLEQPTYTVVVLLIQIITSFMLFLSIQYFRPFYNSVSQKIWQIISGVVFYTNIMLFFSYCFEVVILQDTMIGWLITVPMLALILSKDEKIQLDILKIDVQHCQTEVEIIKKCDFLLDLAENYEKDQNKEILLTGFLEIHKCNCNNINCPVERNDQLTNSYRNHSKYCSKKNSLFELINIIYEDSLSELPINVNLRIHYAHHLIDYMKQNYKALGQLEIAEEQNPSFDQDFIIYRSKKLMQETTQKQQLDHEFQSVLASNYGLSFQYKQLLHLIEESSYFHQNFWNELLEEAPNLSFLNSCGIQIISNKQQIKQQYAQMKRTGEVSFKTEKILSKFYTQVFHEEFFLKADIPLLPEMKEFTYEKYIEDSKDLSCYSSPVLILEIFNNIKQPTVIQNINQEVLALLGFSKGDLIGRPLSMIMPEMYRLNYISFLQIHYSRVEQYFTEMLQDDIDHNQKEKHFFLKTKANYIIPVLITNLNVETERGYLQFLQIRFVFNRAQSGYILFDLLGKIQYISSSCHFLINIDQRLILAQQLMIQQLFPKLFENTSQYLGKMSILNQYNDYNTSCKLTKRAIMESSLLIEDIQTKFPHQLWGQLLEQKICNGSSFTNEIIQQTIGYVLKIEKYHQISQNIGNLTKQDKNQFQFRYNLKDKSYIMESFSPTASQVESGKQESSPCDKQIASSINCTNLKSKKSQTFVNITGTSVNELGIRTMRLLQGQLIEVQDEENSEEESEVQESRLKIESEANIVLLNKTIQVKNSNDLLAIIKSGQIPKRLYQSIFSSNLLILLLVTLTIVMYLLIMQIENQIKHGLSLLSNSNLRYASILKVQSDLQDLRGCVLNFEVSTQISSGGKFLQINRIELQNEVDNLIALNKLLTSATFDLGEQYQNVIDEYYNSNVPVYSRNGNGSENGDIKYFQYSELILQMVSKAILLNNNDSKVFVEDNDDFYFFLYNSFNSVPQYQHVASNFYYYNIIGLITKLDNYEDVFIVLSTFMIFLIYISFQFYLYTHSLSIKEVLCMFLDLSENQVKLLLKETQSFIQYLQLGNNEDDDNEQQYQEGNDLDSEFVKTKKRKLFTYKVKNQLRLQIQWLIITTLVFAYFIYLYFSSIAITESSILVIPLVNLTSYLPAYYRFLDDSVKETIFNENPIILNKPSSIDYLNQLVEQAYNLNAELHVSNQQNDHIVEKSYKASFNQIYFKNPCSIIIEIDTTQVESNCLAFYNKILQKGLAITIANILENQRFLLQQYSYFDPLFQYRNLTYNVSSDNRRNYVVNVLNTKKETSDRKIQKVYIKACHEYLIKSLVEDLNNHFTKLQFQLSAQFSV